MRLPVRGGAGRRACLVSVLAALAGGLAPLAAAQEPVRDAPRPPAADLPFERVQVLVDASGSMRARFGPRTRMQAASEALRTLERRLSRAGAAPPTVWAFGSRTHRLQRDCRDVVRLPAAGAIAAAERLEPRGVSPLVHGLERMLAAAPEPGREAWVVVTDGADNCGRDPCTWAAETLAGRLRPRIYVIGLGLEPEDAAALRCLTEPTSGYLLDLRAEGDAAASVRRLAAVMRDRGTLRIEARGPRGRPVDVQARVYGLGEGAPVRVLRSGRELELPGGMYRVVLETLPPSVRERVLVLPGAERVVRIEGLAAIVAHAWSAGNEPLPAWFSVASEDTSGAEAYVPAGNPLPVRPGRYRVAVEIGDSVAFRETVVLAPGELAELSVGGTGWLVARAGVLAAPDVAVELQPHAGGRPRRLRPWNEAAALPAGSYRARVETLPPYVQERLTVAPAETTSLFLPGLGTLSVDVRDALGRAVDARVTLLRSEGPAEELGEAAPGSVLGTFPAGRPQVVLEGIYDLLVEGGAPRVERGVRVVDGLERVVRVSLDAPAPADGT